MNKKIKKVFDKMDPVLQEVVKFLINDIAVKTQRKKLENNEKKAWLLRKYVVYLGSDWD